MNDCKLSFNEKIKKKNNCFVNFKIVNYSVNKLKCKSWYDLEQNR